MRLGRAKSTARSFSTSEQSVYITCHAILISNSRRDGSTFVNLLMIAPLCDARGKIRYHIGAQVDVSGLVKDCTDLESLQRLVDQQQNRHYTADGDLIEVEQDTRDEFQELSEMLNMGELETVRRWGGRMHREYQDDDGESVRNGGHKPRLLLQEPTAESSHSYNPINRASGKLGGVYHNVQVFGTSPPTEWEDAD